MGAARRRLDEGEWLERLRANARERGGELLSSSYRGAFEKYRWRCAAGHEWEAIANSVRQGTWCPDCALAEWALRRRQRTMGKVRAAAESHGGICLSEDGDYSARGVSLRFRCREGHEWEATPASILSGSWCLLCARNAQRLTLDDLRRTAAERGGECLANEYVNGTTLVRWRCADGHEWEATASSVRSGNWCPHCAGHASKTLDELQAMAAAQGGVCLAERAALTTDEYSWRCRVGHVFNATGAFVGHGGWCPRCRKIPKGDLERMHRIARRRGGECLAAEYLGCDVHLRWRCGEGHEWEAKPEQVVQGSWCPICSKRRGAWARLTIDDMRATAAARGGRCLSDDYVNSVTKLRWQCALGHEFELAPAERNRHWCPTCAPTARGSIDGMRALAAERGGRCLSRDYTGHKTVLEFACEAGHRFKLTGMAVKSGAWCPKCPARVGGHHR